MEKLMTPQTFAMMQRLVEDRLGMVLEEEKAYLLESKIGNMLSRYSFKSFEELYTHICYKNDHELIDEIIDAITINETFWFRDKTPWLIMEELLLPQYIEEFRAGKREHVRIWSGACSYGQEPYSIAMGIDRYLKTHNIHDVSLDYFEIVATDLSNTVLKKAKAGEYDSISMHRGLEDLDRFTYFKNEGKIWRINEKIRQAVRFQQFNLIKEFFPNNKYDIIFFRNVLIYFTQSQKKAVMSKISESLKSNGILFLGSSELFDNHSPDFLMTHYKNGIYYNKQV
ncbi:MAG: protein-glutamate O-methyltransferase CheR [Vallitaleaceae bacterium]|nr:protein-glutamate O-methyltransferase CheR [Vallitaleaceae bacterium]